MIGGYARRTATLLVVGQVPSRQVGPGEVHNIFHTPAEDLESDSYSFIYRAIVS